jgi:hypothetical protein
MRAVDGTSRSARAWMKIARARAAMKRGSIMAADPTTKRGGRQVMSDCLSPITAGRWNESRGRTIAPRRRATKTDDSSRARIGRWMPAGDAWRIWVGRIQSPPAHQRRAVVLKVQPVAGLRPGQVTGTSASAGGRRVLVARGSRDAPVGRAPARSRPSCTPTNISQKSRLRENNFGWEMLDRTRPQLIKGIGTSTQDRPASDRDRQDAGAGERPAPRLLDIISCAHRPNQGS